MAGKPRPKAMKWELMDYGKSVGFTKRTPRNFDYHLWITQALRQNVVKMWVEKNKTLSKTSHILKKSKKLVANFWCLGMFRACHGFQDLMISHGLPSWRCSTLAPTHRTSQCHCSLCQRLGRLPSTHLVPVGHEKLAFPIRSSRVESE